MTGRRKPARRHDVRGRDGKFTAAAPAKHIRSTYPAAAVRPADFRPHRPGAQVTRTAGANPNPPATQQAAPDVATGEPRAFRTADLQ